MGAGAADKSQLHSHREIMAESGASTLYLGMKSSEDSSHTLDRRESFFSAASVKQSVSCGVDSGKVHRRVESANTNVWPAGRREKGPCHLPLCPQVQSGVDRRSNSVNRKSLVLVLL